MIAYSAYVKLTIIPISTPASMCDDIIGGCPLLSFSFVYLQLNRCWLTFSEEETTEAVTAKNENSESESESEPDEDP